ncbi:DUF262 domain-containing protein [Pseudoalteromonas sp. EB27]|uniref:DUF262 domain-containing protein n=1 Tax=Pseudoalteromonas sp. EB27 TaxID=1938368 RepID=UPI00097746D8|nr:DUF262 domain-containing protein [Pseudoalteromonas sp. EB27]
MKTDLYSISKIFTERLFRIPDYQRGYAWSDKHLKDYWSDLVQLEKDKNHYVGVITLEEAPDKSVQNWTDDHWIIQSKSFSPFHVVDGQQRLTTTIVLIQSICEVVGEDGTLNYDPVSLIKKKYIYDSKDGGISRSYLFGYEYDNPSYNFLKAEIFNEKRNVKHPLDSTIYTQNLINAKTYFLNKLKALDISEIENIYKKVTQHFLFAIYSMSDDIDVYITFETMNNRGKPLSHLELLKNRLIYLSTKFDTDNYERQELRRTINLCWKAIYHHLGRNKDNLLDDDLFLLNHFILYFGKDIIETDSISTKQLRRGYRHTFKDYLLEEKFTVKSIKTDGTLNLQDVNEYVTSLKTSVEDWYQILNPKSSQYSEPVKECLARLNRIGISQYLPLIMTVFRMTVDQKLRLDFLSAIERQAFVHSLIMYRMYIEMDDGSIVEICNQLSAKEINILEAIKKISLATDDILNRKELLKIITDNFKGSRGFYSWDGVRYFLYEYEVSLREQSKTYSDKLSWDVLKSDERDYHTIEHIYPQNPRKKEWTSLYSMYTSKQKTLLKHSLGNLVPLSKPKNSSFSNKPFEEKKSNKNNTVGFIYGCFSENEIAKNERWTAKEILDRGVRLLQFMERRWNISIGNKVEFLGLGFVEDKLKKEREKKS